MLMRNYQNWDGQVIKKLILSGELPEYKYLIYPDGSYVPHDSPYHGETLLYHVCRVVDEAAKLSKRFQLSEDEHIILIISAAWHDVGKIFTRREKTRLICDVCGKPHSERHSGKCKNYRCHSRSFTSKVVMGYAGHEKVGVGDWLFGNIAIREGFSAELSTQVKELIRNHLDVLTAVKNGEDYPFTKLNLLLSWADEKGRDQPSFEEPNTDKFKKLYREVSNNDIG